MSVTLREWDIPYSELQLGPTIGRGPIATVYKGTWHGDVAVKCFNLHFSEGASPADDDANRRLLHAFKLEVASLKKTRHDNLVLFMGACLSPPKLAIVTALCRGRTLFQEIHFRKDHFTINKAILIATQITQVRQPSHRHHRCHPLLSSPLLSSPLPSFSCFPLILYYLNTRKK